MKAFLKCIVSFNMADCTDTIGRELHWNMKLLNHQFIYFNWKMALCYCPLEFWIFAFWSEVWPSMVTHTQNLTHPSAHTHSSEHTHTHTHTHTHMRTHTYTHGSVDRQCCGARGAVGGSVTCSKVSPQSWYWRWRGHSLFTQQFLPDLRFEPNKSDALCIKTAPVWHCKVALTQSVLCKAHINKGQMQKCINMWNAKI